MQLVIERDSAALKVGALNLHCNYFLLAKGA